jgi:hypothetical protein
VREHPAWRSPLHTIRDRIAFSTAAAQLRHPSFAIVDQLQFHPPEVQLDALFVTAVAMATVVGLDPHEMVSRARRLLPAAEGPFTDHLQAVKDYAKGELK